MKKLIKSLTLLSIMTFTGLTFSLSAYACATASLEINPEILVENAQIIVRAAAVGYGDPSPPDSRIRFIEFRVREVLKGRDVPGKFLIKGILTETDDFNDRPVPYSLVRSMGRTGGCHAIYYKQGAEFLLFLKRHDSSEERSRGWGEATPYWAAMAATNEQLRSSSDEWLLWVKEYLRTNDGTHKIRNILFQIDTPHNRFNRSANGFDLYALDLPLLRLSASSRINSVCRFLIA